MPINSIFLASKQNARSTISPTFAQIWRFAPSPSQDNLCTDTEEGGGAIGKTAEKNKIEETLHMGNVIVCVFLLTYFLSPSTRSVSPISPMRNSTRYRSGAAHRIS